MRYFQSFTSKAIIQILSFLLPFFVYAQNKPPQVDAGAIRRVIYPATTSATLLGSGSDAEGPVTFQWKQVGGNSVAKIVRPKNDTTKVNNLIPGLYTFVLSATDKAGVTRTDTTHVTVLEKLTWTTLGSFRREVLVHPSTGGSGPAPVVFAWHGHGGTDSGFAQRAFEVYWPEAIVVYPQGLRTAESEDTTNCRLSGWQRKVGEVNCRNGRKDQDLVFFDTIMVTLKKKYSVNSNLVFAHGWSNGADFVYNVLWTARANKLAGISPAGVDLQTITGKSPIPVMQVAGTEDIRVPFATAKEDNQQVRTLNKCSTQGTVWATGPSELLATHYDSPINDPVVFLQYNGGHAYPFTVPALIIKFFKEVAGASTTPLITKAPPMNKHLAGK